MTTPSKPILHNGFKVKDNLTVKNRVERIFFTEVYSLSDGKYLYVFTNIKHDEVLDRSKKYDLVTLDVAGKKYLGVINDEHSHKQITDIIDNLTTLRGFDCVAGMKSLKNLLINEVIEPLLNPEKYKKFKLGIPNGILLFGPPGCGKTFIVKKLADELGYNFVEMNPSSVATSYVHGAVGNIGKVFEMARLQAPSIIFIDEIEGLIPKREELSSSADIKKEEINEFLLQLNNAGENKILVVGATNRPHMIDTAILRSGRMDKRIFVGPPDFEARRDLFKICLSGRPYEKDIDFEKLAKLSENYVGSDIELVVTEAARAAVSQDKSRIDEKMLVDAIKKFTPSISPEEIEYYSQFGDLERSNCMISTEQRDYRILFSKIAAIALLVAVIPIWPYFFYQALKLIVFGAAAFSAYLYHKEKDKGWMLTMIGIAIVFNPIDPLYFGHFLWSIVDIIVALLFYKSPKHS